MSKRHITYTKPDEPTFLKRIKRQVGYKEGPTVDTKRENRGPIDDDGDYEDPAEERPTVVVLKPGDLTAEEAAEVNTRIEKEQEETPADLSKPIVFKAPPKTQTENKEVEQPPSKSEKTSKKSSNRSKGEKSKKSKTTLLSFNDDDDEDEAGDF